MTQPVWRRRKRRGRGRGRVRGRDSNPTEYDDIGVGTPSGHGLTQLGNATGVGLDDDVLVRWLEARHNTRQCSWNTPVYFAPFSPNGIGNKLMAMVMAFHIALMSGRSLVVSDWPPSTLRTDYVLSDFLLPSSCQALFDGDTTRPKVRKCTVISCPLRTNSRFTKGLTQMHWAHQAPQFLELPREWAHLDWITWWRAISQFLLRPGPKLMRGLAATLARSSLLSSSGSSNAAALGELLHRVQESEREAASDHVGFARRFASGVVKWTGGRRPLVGAHVRLGDGCYDSKRGGCKYIRSFSEVVTRLREAGISSGAQTAKGGWTEPRGWTKPWGALSGEAASSFAARADARTQPCVCAPRA